MIFVLFVVLFVVLLAILCDSLIFFPRVQSPAMSFRDDIAMKENATMSARRNINCLLGGPVTHDIAIPGSMLPG